jgi:hypothetical protein
MSGINFKDTIEKRLENLYLHFRRWGFFIVVTLTGNLLYRRSNYAIKQL